ncbi:uncharacterized protein STEHIDRAFT_107012 [Stereum hirsutum FP-91666 SS1]|uniref:uncharacterized protein n=1 Tax=Stereum hirsutum (strain FP-91666) TaxID=721885 RepID=UPI000440D5AF|nr:uncharacterized protein STEHIDRAFT_107012 [Stereum hirsutum FP-91666 SS1]EIM92523.1 hypothetical protein STEHIDRAFT_107012 [Stereum hirsutum FP-91666 SS1]
MSWLASLVLALIHSVYSLFIWLRTVRANRHERIPLELNAKRSKTPKHLGLILAYDASLDGHEELEQVLVACLRSAVGCAQAAGIEQLTVYDRDGLLSTCPNIVRDCMSSPRPAESLLEPSRPELVYPLTPPLSEDSDSSTSAPWNDTPDARLNVVTVYSGGGAQDKRKRYKGKRRRSNRKSLDPSSDERTFSVNLVSRDSGKPAIASVANHLRTSRTPETPSTAPSVTDLDHILEGENGFSPPDLIIVHHITPEKYANAPLELYGFPPWQVRLSEIYHSQHHSPSSTPHWRWPGISRGRHRSHRDRCSVLEEIDFRRALDEFSGAEMRLGT